MEPEELDMIAINAARELWDRIAEINASSATQGQLYQDYRAERADWVEQVAEIIKRHFA